MCGSGSESQGASTAGGMRGRGTCMAGGHAWWGAVRSRGACVAGETAIAAGSTHPTGMHSCSFNLFLPTRCVRIPFS